ncbi:MAG: class I SAM-dependent RNA methyltransferase [Proteobacteria bacterium]|nr:class I SAM-dependent RNA methyltransferase [Pseudomonadota bacterium]
MPKPENISPCSYFPKCGGCDFLDLKQQDYQKLKLSILDQAFHGHNFSSTVKPDWIWIEGNSRRKIILQIGKKNQLGFFTKQSKEIVEIENCFVAEKEISKTIFLLKNFLKTQEQNIFTQLSITLFDNGLDLIFIASKEPSFTQAQKIISFAKEQNFNVSYKIKNHLTPIFLARQNQIFFTDFKISLDSEVFIQATKSGLAAIVKIIRDFLIENQNIKNIADIYAGFGVYSFAIQDIIKSVLAFEGDKKMTESINKNAAVNNLAQKIKAENHDLFASPVTKRDLSKFDLAIINPPRNGASPQALEIAKSSLKNVIYVSCNPNSFARDAKILIDSGLKIKKLTALDQFYSTKHLELVAIFTK